MSTTNREKRKQAKRKARERRVRARHKPTPMELLEGIRHLPEAERTRRGMALLEEGKISRRAVDRFIMREASSELAWERDAFYPDLAERLAADGWAETEKPVYLRFGELPEDGRSTTEVGGIWEKGISVFAGRLTKAGHYVIKVASWGYAIEFLRLCEEEDRDAYFVTGKRAGKGGAKEPLLKTVVSCEPVPDGCVIAVPGGSCSLDRWNDRRFGGYLEDVPELARYFEELAG